MTSEATEKWLFLKLRLAYEFRELHRLRQTLHLPMPFLGGIHKTGLRQIGDDLRLAHLRRDLAWAVDGVRGHSQWSEVTARVTDP